MEFLDLIQWIILLDVILSWTVLLGINFQPRFIKAITVPLYEMVRKYIPTTFSGMDFAPIVIYIGINIASTLLILLDPAVKSYISRP